MSELLIYRERLPLEQAVLEGDGRSVTMRLLTYGRGYRVSDDGVVEYEERWAPGAFKRSLAYGKGAGIALAYEHDRGPNRSLPVGGSRRAWEDDGALMMEGRISRTSTGDDLVELIRDQVINGVSIEARVFRSKPFLGGHERLEAQLRRVAFTEAPAYDDAAVLAMRSHPSGGMGTPRLDAVRARLAALS